MTDTSRIRWRRDEDGVVILTLDNPAHSANTWDSTFAAAFAAVVDRLAAESDQIRGVILSSAKRTFFAGGDLNELLHVARETSAAFATYVRNNKADLRRLETLGVPVVAAINGAALGGGLEICLACHRRVIVSDPRAVVGFPEVQLGLLPGAGGVARSVRLLGVTSALARLLLQGGRLTPQQALELGVVDDVVPAVEDLIPAARRWIADAANGGPVMQPWDADPGYRIPGGVPSSPAFAAKLPALPANLRKQLKGADYPAPRRIMAAAVEGAQVDFDGALEIEGRYFVELVCGQVAKNMIQAFFFDMQRVSGDRGRPAEVGDPYRPRRVVVLGAGMMGAAIAYVCAKAGIEVVLKDVTLQAAKRGKAYSEGLVRRAVEKGRSSPSDADALLALITPAAEPGVAAGADLVIEAVFEDPAVKAQVFAEIEPHLAPGALLGSNTSTLPITGLAAGVSRAEDFIGLHFFSPVDKMPLLEIITGEATSEATLQRALDLARLIRKTPIVVGDSRGFFTSRVIMTFLNEGIAMLAEGVPAATVEQAASQAGYPAPVLQLADELNLELMAKIRAVSADGSGDFPGHPAFAVIDRMIELGRAGRVRGAGFYQYRDGSRVRLWPGLDEHFPRVGDPAALRFRDLIERMLFAEALEAVRCRQEGVIESVADANIGSILGIGFPGWTGGVLQYINGYPGGPAGFVARCRELDGTYGERFTPPASLVDLARRGGTFTDSPDLVATVVQSVDVQNPPETIIERRRRYGDLHHHRLRRQRRL
jgi:3-hydroxyacyl-CoA dehydrogenase/enoyl-CoA hydratase/3-hydroxybutyryl-CoA epimerase